MMGSNQSTKKRVLVTDSEFFGSIPEVNSQFDDIELVCPADASSLAETAHGSFDGIITKFAVVNEEMLNSLKGVRALVKMGRNYYNVDADAVRKNGIQFGSSPRKGPNCVAEMALTFILALSKDLLINHEAVATGSYRYRGIKPQRTEQWKFAFHWMKNERVHEIRGKTLGIVGLGEVGCELALRANALGMHVLYIDINRLSAEMEQRYQVTYQSLNEILKQSDYVSLHVPHTPDNEKMIGKEQFAMMKSTAYLINTCRGGVVDEEAMINALSENIIAGAGLDVMEYEPLPVDSPLCDLDNVIMMPHIGGGTGTNKVLELSEAVTEISRILSGQSPKIDLSR